MSIGTHEMNPLQKQITEVILEHHNAEPHAYLEAARIMPLIESAIQEARKVDAAVELEQLEVSNAIHDLPREYVEPLKFRLEVAAGLTNSDTNRETS